jgi:hypothetical protein
MTNVDKTVIKENTKQHKAIIRTAHNNIVEYVQDFKGYLIQEGRMDRDEDVINTLRGIVGYLKAHKKLVFKELDELAESLLQEEPVEELTKSSYNLIKKILAEHHRDLSNEIISTICKHIDTNPDRLNNVNFMKTVVVDVVTSLFNKDLFVLLELLDENVVTTETVLIAGLKEENSRLKAQLDNIKTLMH